MYSRFISLLIVIFFAMQVSAQGLEVKNFYHDERDGTANRGSTRILDSNEEPCALIKVRTMKHGFKFDSGLLLPVKKTEEQTSAHPLEIYVWVQSGAKRISIGHDKFGTIYEYNLAQHLKSGKLESGQTYILELDTKEVELPSSDISPKTNPSKGVASLTQASTAILTFTVKGVSFTMVKVEAGTLVMGGSYDEEDDEVYDDEDYPIRRVTIKKDYYIGETEVTQDLWEAVMGINITQQLTNSNKRQGTRFSLNGVGYNYPMYLVSREECITFIGKLNELTGAKFRLPTEEEWEFAARGGKKSRGYNFSGSNLIDEVAWYENNSKTTRPVKQKAANELGLYDMSGNVEEWCFDFGDRYGIVRGGHSGECGFAEDCHVTSRCETRMTFSSDQNGFRLALDK